MMRSTSGNPPMALPVMLALSTMGFMGFNAVIGLISRELGMSELQTGIVVAVGGVGLMLSSRRWGRLSDRIGRRPVIRMGLGGYIAGFALLFSFLAMTLPASVGVAGQALVVPATVSFVVLLTVRLLLSVSVGGSVTATQAYIADTTTPETRSRGMALLGMGQAFGMIFGPALAGLMAIWSLIAPVAVAIVLGAIAIWIASTRLPVLVRSASRDVVLLPWFDERLRFAMTTAFAAMCCVMSAQIVTGFFAQDRLGLPTAHAASVAGGALAAVGIALTIAQVVVTRWSASPRTLVLRGAPIAAVGFGSIMFVTAPWQMVVCYFVAGFGMGLVFPAYQAASANAVDAHEQGAAAGTVGAAHAFGQVVGPLIATALYRSVDPSAPFAFSALILCLVALMALREPRMAPLPAVVP